jgi:NAD(P)H-flavin reductase
MVKQQAAVFRQAYPAPPYWVARFDVVHPPAPGAFMLADLGGPLREALFPAAIDAGRADTGRAGAANGFSVMLPPRHPATRLLPGATVDMLGPLGQGFRLGAATRLLLVAEVAYLPPLLPLLEAAPAVALVLEAPTRAQLPPPDRFPPAVELTLVTRDGSAGYLGPLESPDPAPANLERVMPRLLELISWAECVCCACANDRYPALAALVRAARIQPTADFAQALVQAPMPCGVGACEVCRTSTRAGEKHACIDGPVFDMVRNFA